MLVYLRLSDGTTVSISQRTDGMLARRMRPAGDRAAFMPIDADLRRRLTAVFGTLTFGPESA